ncbi:MAG: metal-dependent hydrolase [Candidatus Hodarchaeales archaeon]
MTYSPTHFAITGLFVWTMMGEEKRKEFTERKKGIFLLLNLIAVLPDFDFIFLAHRGVSHSLFTPLLILLVGLVARKELAKLDDEKAFYGDIIILAAIFWQIHIILDIGMGPLAILWPFSEEYYDFYFAIETSIEPFGFLPFTITGLKMGVERLSPSEGRLSYVYNWSPEERIARFGPEPINWNVPDLFLHIIIVILWIAVVGRKLLPEAVNSWFSAHKVRDYFLVFRNRMIIPATFVMFLALAVGPLQGPIQIDNEEQIESDLVIGPTSFLPGIWLDPVLEKTANGIATVEISKINGGRIGLVDVSRNEAQEFATSLFEGWNESRNVSQSVDNGTFSTQSVSMAADFPSKYSRLIEHIRNKTNFQASLANSNELGPLKLDSGDQIALVYVHTWDLDSFQNGPWEIRLVVKTSWNRNTEYLLAGLIGVAGALLLFFPALEKLRRLS